MSMEQKTYVSGRQQKLIAKFSNKPAGGKFFETCGIPVADETGGDSSETPEASPPAPVAEVPETMPAS